MNFIEKQGIKPTNNENEYIFSEEEILTLIQTYIQQEICLNVDLYIQRDADYYLEYDGFTIELEKDYDEFCESEVTVEQLDTLFEDWEMQVCGCNKVLAEMFGYEVEEMKLKYDIKNERYIIRILTEDEVENAVKELQLTDRHVKSMRDHSGDYVDDVEQLAEDWLEMKRTLKWMQKHAKDENILKRVEKLLGS